MDISFCSLKTLLRRMKLFLQVQQYIILQVQQYIILQVQQYIILQVQQYIILQVQQYIIIFSMFVSTKYRVLLAV